MRNAVADGDGNGFCVGCGWCDSEAHHAGAGVDGVLLVENEVSDAVVDGMALEMLNGLQGVGVVADDDVSPGANKAVGLHALNGQRLERVFHSPVQAKNDVGIGMVVAQTTDAAGQRFGREHAGRRLLWQICVIL